MNKSDLLAFMRTHRFVVEATASRDARPQAAVVGVIVTDAFEIVFDTVETSRKFRNLATNPAMAFVFGGTGSGDERTVQYEGVADIPTGPERDELKELYLARFPDGRDRQQWDGLVYVRVRPRWVRYSDFTQTPPQVVEFNVTSV